MKISDFPLFASNLDKRGIPLVVLRWWNSIPLTDDQEKEYKDDVDCLIDENNIWPIIKLAAKHPGVVKVDFYGICGRNGTSYKGLPYYPPTLAQKIYQSRVWNDGYYVPSKEAYKFSLVYHVVYHKGTDAGLRFDRVEAGERENKFCRELSRLGESDADLKNTGLTLLELHKYLKARGWSMPVDLMSRWRGNQEVISQLRSFEEAQLSTIAEALKGLVAFIIRDDAYVENSIGVIRSMLTRKFAILIEYRLSAEQSNAIMNNTRGGNWIEKRRKTATKPTELWVCKPKAQTPFVSRKMKRKYPLVDNYEVLIKREIRDKVNGIDEVKRYVLHASDNDIESSIIFKSAFNEDAQNEIRKLKSMFQADNQT